MVTGFAACALIYRRMGWPQLAEIVGGDYIHDTIPVQSGSGNLFLIWHPQLREGEWLRCIGLASN